MLNSYDAEKLLGLQKVEVKKIQENEKIFEIEIEQPRKQCICPLCGQKTDKIHDYRRQRVKELPAFGKCVTLILRKRRYVCPCGKRFAEPNTFLTRYASGRFSYAIEYFFTFSSDFFTSTIDKEPQIGCSVPICKCESFDSDQLARS